MRLYTALVGLIHALTEATNAWAETERLNTLENEFADMDADGYEAG